MTRKSHIMLGSLMAAGLMVSGTALAQNGPTYTFTVPVSVSEVHPDVPAVRVYCSLRVSSGLYITSGYQDVPLDANRAFSGTLTIEIDITDPAVLDSVEDWFCNIQHEGAYGWISSHQDPNVGVEYFHVNGDASYEYVGEY